MGRRYERAHPPRPSSGRAVENPQLAAGCGDLLDEPDDESPDDDEGVDEGADGEEDEEDEDESPDEDVLSAAGLRLSVR